MSDWHGDPIRSIRDLLRALAGGGRLVHYQPWQVSQETGWREWVVVHRDQSRQGVDPRIAVTAHRKGMVTYEETDR